MYWRDRVFRCVWDVGRGAGKRKLSVVENKVMECFPRENHNQKTMSNAPRSLTAAPRPPSFLLQENQTVENLWGTRVLTPKKNRVVV